MGAYKKEQKFYARSSKLGTVTFQDLSAFCKMFN